MPDTPLLVLIGVVVAALSVLSIWQYGVTLRRQSGQQDVADRQQNVADGQQVRVASLLERQEMLMDRAALIVQRLSDQLGANKPDA